MCSAVDACDSEQPAAQGDIGNRQVSYPPAKPESRHLESRPGFTWQSCGCGTPVYAVVSHALAWFKPGHGRSEHEQPSLPAARLAVGVKTHPAMPRQTISRSEACALNLRRNTCTTYTCLTMTYTPPGHNRNLVITSSPMTRNVKSRSHTYSSK